MSQPEVTVTAPDESAMAHATLSQKIADLEREKRAKENRCEPPQINLSESFSAKLDPISIAKSKCKGKAGREYNILLWGETGVGKSTFINAFSNYLTFSTLDKAKKGKAKAPIAGHFTLYDKNYDTKTVKFGKDNNEKFEAHHSTTQNCKAHEFQVDDFTLRFIDSRGMEDGRDEVQDQLNRGELLTFLNNYEQLHAICILFKSNQRHITSTFAWSIKELLCHLHHKVGKNILFVFTHSRGNNIYQQGDIFFKLKSFFDEIRKYPPRLKIPFRKDNVFCLNNESFRFLIALHNGVHLNENDLRSFGLSWTSSVEEILRMMRYIFKEDEAHGLIPSLVEEILSVYEGRPAIINLAQPMSTLGKNIQMNIQVLKLRQDEIRECSNDEDKLKDILYLPKVSLIIKELDGPGVVCTGPKCRQIYKVGSIICYHYPQKCHNPCYLLVIPNKIVNKADKLRYCSAIDDETENCHQCGCNYKLHSYIYYESEEADTRVVDESIPHQLMTKEGTAANDMIMKLEDEIVKYKMEEDKLWKYTAKLAVYSLVQNDWFKVHLLEMIENERWLHTKGSRNADVIKGLEEMLVNYETEKSILESKAFNSQTDAQRITIKEVGNILEEICNMEKIGINFKKLLIAQRAFDPITVNSFF